MEFQLVKRPNMADADTDGMTQTGYANKSQVNQPMRDMRHPINARGDN